MNGENWVVTVFFRRGAVGVTSRVLFQNLDDAGVYNAIMDFLKTIMDPIPEEVRSGHVEVHANVEKPKIMDVPTEIADELVSIIRKSLAAQPIPITRRNAA